MTTHSQYGKRQHALTERDGQGPMEHLHNIISDKNEKQITTK